MVPAGPTPPSAHVVRGQDMRLYCALVSQGSVSSMGKLMAGAEVKDVID